MNRRYKMRRRYPGIKQTAQAISSARVEVKQLASWIMSRVVFNPSRRLTRDNF